MVPSRQRLSYELWFLALLSKCVLLPGILEDLARRVLRYFVFYLLIESSELGSIWLETVLALVPALAGNSGTPTARVFVCSSKFYWVYVVLVQVLRARVSLYRPLVMELRITRRGHLLTVTLLKQRLHIMRVKHLRRLVCVGYLQLITTRV